MTDVRLRGLTTITLTKPEVEMLQRMLKYDIGAADYDDDVEILTKVDDMLNVSEGICDQWGALLFVNVYMVSRAYGGPEEGGWYFDAYHPEESVPVDSIDTIEKTFRDIIIDYDLFSPQGEEMLQGNNLREFIINNIDSIEGCTAAIQLSFADKDAIDDDVYIAVERCPGQSATINKPVFC